MPRLCIRNNMEEFHWLTRLSLKLPRRMEYFDLRNGSVSIARRLQFSKFTQHTFSSDLDRTRQSLKVQFWRLKCSICQYHRLLTNTSLQQECPVKIFDAVRPCLCPLGGGTIRTGMWAWCNTCSLTLPKTVLLTAPRPLCPNTTFAACFSLA